MAARLRPAALALLAACGSAAGEAPLPDPTRPPARFAAPAGVAAAEGPVLQSVRLPRQGRASAVIDGRQVLLGERFADARLERVSETEAVLVGPAGRQVLRLTPAAHKDTRQNKNRSGH